MDPLKDLEILSLIIHSMEYLKEGTTYGKFYGLFVGMILGQEDGIVLRSAVIVVDGELCFSKV